MLNNSTLKQYTELKKAVDALNNQLKGLKNEILEELKKTDCTIDSKGNLIFTFTAGDLSAVLNIANTETIDTAAVKKMYPGEFLKPGTRETLTIKAN